jgi:hypothetical protein
MIGNWNNYMRAEFMKLCLFHYFKFRRKNIVISEHFIGDNNIFTVNKKGVQSQIKIISSKKSLKEEFIKGNKINSKEMKYRLSRVELFYFCVPEKLVKDALLMIESNENFRGIGLISISFKFSRPKVLNRFYKRVSFELIAWRNQKAKRYTERDLLHILTKEIFFIQKKFFENISGMRFSDDGESQYIRERKMRDKKNHQKPLL